MLKWKIPLETNHFDQISETTESSDGFDWWSGGGDSNVLGSLMRFDGEESGVVFYGIWKKNLVKPINAVSPRN